MVVARTSRHFFLILLLLGIPAPAAGQAQPPPPPPWQEGTAELAFVGTSGNSSTTTFSVGGEHLYRPTQWIIRNRARMVRTETDGDVAADSLLYAFRAERTLTARMTAYGDYGYFHDRPAGVDHRHGVTGGLTAKLAENARHSLQAEVGAGYLNEQRLTGDDVSSGVYSTGAVYKLKVSATTELTEELKLLGTFDHSADWRVANAIGLTVTINTIFSLKASNLVRYAQFPPPGFKTTDSSTSIALVASFKRQ